LALSITCPKHAEAIEMRYSIFVLKQIFEVHMMSDSQKPTTQRLNLEVPANLAAIYANFAIITHSMKCFSILHRFCPIFKARVQTRLVLTPTNAKMLKALEEDRAVRSAEWRDQNAAAPKLAGGPVIQHDPIRR
jgi:hypothetical protein